MKSRMTKNGLTYVALLAALTGVAGCFVAVGDVSELARRVTYPPDFRYIERDEIKGAMWQLAFHARELNHLIHAPGDIEMRRAAIVTHLNGMEVAATTLESDGRPTNHPLLESHLPRLHADVRAARIAVEQEPANYLLAATVSGTCLPCHTGAP